SRTVWQRLFQYREHWGKAIGVADVEQHRLANLTRQPSRREINHKQRLAALDFRLQVGAFPTKACQYRTPAITKVDRALDELAGSRNDLHSFDRPDTNVDFLEMVHRDLGFDRSGDETGHVLCSIAVIATASISIRYPGRARTETAIAVTDGAIVLRQISASKSLPHKYSLVSGFGVASRHLVRTDKAGLPSSAVLAKRARRCRAQRP